MNIEKETEILEMYDNGVQVKAIAEESGIKMPSFFGYMFKFSLIVLLPIYILVQLLFL